MPVRGGVVVTTTQPALPPGVTPDLPSTAGTLPVFTVGGIQPHISDSVYRQRSNGTINIGTGSTSTGNNGVAIGVNSGDGGLGQIDIVAIGNWARAGRKCVAIGAGALASYNTGGIAIGENANAGPGNGGANLVLGRNATVTGNGGLSIVIGNLAAVNSPAGTHIVIGNNALVLTGVSNNSGIAIGTSSQAKHGTAIALGAFAVTTQIGEVVIGDVASAPISLFTIRPAAALPVRHRNSTAGWAIRDVGNLNDIFKVDESAVAGDARLLLWDVSTGLLKRVTFGAGPGVNGDVLNKYLRVVV